MQTMLFTLSKYVGIIVIFQDEMYVVWFIVTIFGHRIVINVRWAHSLDTY